MSKQQGRSTILVTLVFAVAALVTLVIWIRQSTVGEIRHYRIPKAPPEQEAPSSPTVAKLQWTAPPDWQELPGGGMREGSFRVQAEGGLSADISVIRLQGDGGGVTANINRWREQLGLPPLLPEEIQSMLHTIDSGLGPVAMVDMASQENLIDGRFKMRMLAAIAPVDRQTLFVKMTGEDALVASLKPSMQAFLASLRIEQKGAKPPHPRGSYEEIQWDAPAYWIKEGASGMRKAGFRIPDEDGSASQLTVTTLDGDGGGNLANINRWRGQLGLPPLQSLESEKSVTTLQVFGADMVLVDIVGAAANGAQPQRMLGGIYFRSGQTWYFKLTGGASSVESAKPSFLAFLQSIRFVEE